MYGLVGIAEAVGEQRRAELLPEHDRRAQRRTVAVVLGREIHQAIEGETVPATHRRLTVARRIPRESESRPDVVAVGREEPIDEIDAGWRQTLGERRALTEHDVP